MNKIQEHFLKIYLIQYISDNEIIWSNCIDFFCRWYSNLLWIKVSHLVTDRSSHRRWSIKKFVFKNFAKFTGKYLCCSRLFNPFKTVEGLMDCVQSRELCVSAHVLPSKIYPARKLRWYVACGFDFRHFRFEIWLSFLAGFTALKGLLMIPVGTMSSF